MEKHKIKEIFKERWRFYLAGYILGYIISLIHSGVPNFLYLIPIKLISIILAICVGDALYYGKQKPTVFRGVARGSKNMVLILLLILIFGCFQKILILCGIDITPFIGF